MRASSNPSTPKEPTLTPVPAGLPDPLPADLQAVVALFDAHLAGVSFPDVDAARLRGLADDVRRLSAEADVARRAMQQAEASAAAALDALRAGAQRGLAYARIYAGALPEPDGLMAAIDAVATPARPATPDVPPRRRGRPRKDAAAQLFAVPAPVPELAEPAPPVA